MRIILTTLAAATLLALSVSNAPAQPGLRSFSFNSTTVRGFPTGEVTLTGGGVYDPVGATVKTGGSFQCLAGIRQGPLNGCRAGEGVRWDAAQLLPSTNFKCSASGVARTAVTDDHTVVIQADFYRRGDGTHESFTGVMIVSALDLDPDEPGIQNVWVQGVGCGEAIVNLR